MNFPPVVRFFSVDNKEPLIPRTAIVTGEGSRPGTLNLEVFGRMREDRHLKGQGVSETALDVPYFEAVPSACEQVETKNTRFIPDGKAMIPAFCCLRFDPKLPVPNIGQKPKS